MRAMILAAGRGERMGPLTSQVPKPLLRVGDYYLIEFAIGQLVKANIREIIINLAYQGKQIKDAIGDGSRYGANIYYSEEKTRLETGGGIVQALDLLGDDPFVVLSADVISYYPLESLPHEPLELAHLVMVDNPHYHPNGDFGINDGFADMKAIPRYTFGNIGVYRRELFAKTPVSYFPLNRVLFPAIQSQQVTGEHYKGLWFNVGTPDDLRVINARAREDSNLRPLASETNTLSS